MIREPTFSLSCSPCIWCLGICSAQLKRSDVSVGQWPSLSHSSPLTMEDAVPDAPKLALVCICGFQLKEKRQWGYS